MTKSALLISSLLVGTPALAGVYNYHPSSPIYLGGGYDPYRPTQALQNCLEWDGVRPLDSGNGRSAVETKARIQTIKSKSDLYSLVDFSSQIQGGYGLFSGEGSVDLIDEYAFHEDSLTWLVLFKTDYGRFRIANERLKSEYARETPEALVRRCGTEVAVTQRKAVMVYATLTVKNLSEVKRHELESKLTVSMGVALWSADMDVEYKKVLRSALAATDFSVSIQAIGGGGVQDLGGLIGSGTGSDAFVQYEQIPQVLQKYIAGLTVDSAAPIEYITASLTDYRPDIPRDQTDFAGTQFQKIYTSYERHSSIVDRLEDLLYGGSASLYRLADAQIQDLQDLLGSHKRSRDALYAAGLACFDRSAACVDPGLADRPVIWPRLKKFDQVCEQNRRAALDAGLVPDEFYEMARRRDLVFLVENGEVVGQESCDLFAF